MSVAQAMEFLRPRPLSSPHPAQDMVARQSQKPRWKKIGFKLSPENEKNSGNILGPVLFWTTISLNQSSSSCRRRAFRNFRTHDWAKPGSGRLQSARYEGVEPFANPDVFLDRRSNPKRRPCPFSASSGQRSCNAAHASDSEEIAQR